MMLFLNCKAHHYRGIFGDMQVPHIHQQPLKAVSHCGTQGFLPLYLV